MLYKCHNLFDMIDYRGNNKLNVLLFVTFQFEIKTNTYKIAQTNPF